MAFEEAQEQQHPYLLTYHCSSADSIHKIICSSADAAYLLETLLGVDVT